MTSVSLVLAILLGQGADRNPADLVRQLGSAKFAEREAALAALEKLGPAALPALRAAGEANDPEVRTRAAAATAAIEWRVMKGASMVRLDAANRTLEDVVARFGHPAPSRLAWHPATPDDVRRKTVSFHEAETLPFWEAVDRLCRTGGLRYIPGSSDGPFDTNRTEYRLYLAPGTWDGPRADSGPLRLEIVGIYHTSDVSLIPNSPRQPGRFSGPRVRPFGEREERFSIQMRLLAEPRMLINMVGNSVIAEAVDDRGHTLLPGPAPHIPRAGYGSGPPARACADYVIHLKYPEQAGKVIKRLKLTIPVGVETTKPDRLEIRLADSLGKPVRHGATSIEVLSVGRDSQGHQKVMLKLSSSTMVPESLTLNPNGTLAPAVDRPARPEVNPNVFQVLDQHGRQFPWHGNGNHAVGAEVTAELMMWPEGGIPIPVRVGNGVVPPADRPTAVPTVLYHTESAREVISGTFEFHDVPLP